MIPDCPQKGKRQSASKGVRALTGQPVQSSDPLTPTSLTVDCTANRTLQASQFSSCCLGMDISGPALACARKSASHQAAVLNAHRRTHAPGCSGFSRFTSWTVESARACCCRSATTYMAPDAGTKRCPIWTTSTGWWVPRNEPHFFRGTLCRWCN